MGVCAWQWEIMSSPCLANSFFFQCQKALQLTNGFAMSSCAVLFKTTFPKQLVLHNEFSSVDGTWSLVRNQGKQGIHTFFLHSTSLFSWTLWGHVSSVPSHDTTGSDSSLAECDLHQDPAARGRQRHTLHSTSQFRPLACIMTTYCQCLFYQKEVQFHRL